MEKALSITLGTNYVERYSCFVSCVQCPFACVVTLCGALVSCPCPSMSKPQWQEHWEDRYRGHGRADWSSQVAEGVEMMEVKFVSHFRSYLLLSLILFLCCLFLILCWYSHLLRTTWRRNLEGRE